MANSQTESRRQRIHRAEALLDRWLDLYEVLLQRAHQALHQIETPPKLPDLTKLTDLANAFTITRRAVEFELLAEKLDSHNQSEKPFILDQNLLLGAIRGDDPDE